MKVMKTLWRLLVILIVVCTLMQTVVAVDTKRTSYWHDKTEFIVGNDVDSAKARQIIATISGEEVITPRGNILCLLGHSTARTTVSETIHCYYATAPRCLRKTYDVTYCTRSGCDYITYTHIGSVAIHCCT